MADNNVNIYEPRKMDRVVSRLPLLHTFFRSTFFGRVVTFDTASVDVDFVKSGRALAPFVHRRIGGETILDDGYETKSYTPPLVAPNRVTTADKLLNRRAGEPLYNGMSPAQRAVKKLGDDFKKLVDMTIRREEWMCAQALMTGKIPIIGKGLNETIDFKFTNTETLTGTKKWTGTAADPNADIKRWYKQVQKTGFVNPTIGLMADDVADAFINNEKMMKLCDTKAYDLAVIKPEQMPNGLTYIGSIRQLKLDLYTYNEWYLDNWSTEELKKNPINMPMVPDGTFALLSTHAEYSMYYGAVTYIPSGQENFVTVERDRVPTSWVERNPDRRFIQINSNPLPVPHEVDSWFVAKVL